MRAHGLLKPGLVALLVSAQAGPTLADQYPEFSVGGLAFGDFYHVVSHHLPEGDGATGFVLRRGYLTFNADFSENIFGRMRFEANQSGEFETYDYEVDFKDLYLGWDLAGHRLMAGLQPTLTFDVIESSWGLRYLMRTPMDLQGIASRDTGISIKGPINDSGSWKYRLMGSTGIEFGSESGDGSKWMGALNWTPAPGWMIDFYVDYEDFDTPIDRTTLQVFSGYTADEWRWGAQYSHQDRDTDPPLELASTFFVGTVGERLEAIGRIDRIIEPSPKGNNISYIPFDPSAPATMYLAGLEYRVNEHFRLIPNVVLISYDRNEEGVRPETDLHLRLTLFINFE